MPLFLTLLFFCLSITFAKQNVLILNSYNQGYTWTDEITNGVLDALRENDNINIYIEHIDILNTPVMSEQDNDSSQNWGIYSILKHKYKNIKLDAVVTIDHAAFEFAKKHVNDLWEGTPIVSCGISINQAQSVDSTSLQWSSIYEFFDMKSQIDFISNLQRNLRRIIFITDDTEIGQNVREQMNSFASANVKNIHLEEWREPKLESLPTFLLRLDPKQDAVVIACTRLQDPAAKSQKFLEIFTEYVNEHSLAPVYTFLNVGVKYGTVGGNVISASAMGNHAGMLVLAILTQNEQFSSGFYRSVSRLVIDEKVATEKKLNMDKLPPETVRINEVETWIDKYQNYMSNLKNAIVFELIVILILGLSFYVFFKHSNRKLRKEKRAVEKANKAKSIFLANMSHEIRTPLNSILGFSELLLDRSSNLTEEQKEWCKTMEISSYHLRDTFNNLLDFSKIEAENIKLEEEWIDVFSLCDDLIGVCRYNLFFKHVKFHVLPSIYLPKFIKTDPIRLKQVLVNLVGNALKFTNEGSVKLTLNLITDGNNNSKIYFEIIDTGIGIPKDKLEKIFDAFEQVDSGRSRKYGGAGLGLTISKNILHAMNSELKVESNKNGSRFYFALPVKIREEAFYKNILNGEKQKVTIHNRDKKVLKYVSQGVEALKGIPTESTNVETLLNSTGQDLLIAEADKLSINHLQKISEIYPRVILIFYRENEKLEEIKQNFPQFKCLFAPIKSYEIIDTIRKLYIKSV